MLDRWLRLWFGFSDPVDRGTYFRHGLGLLAFKYAVVTAIHTRVLHHIQTLAEEDGTR